MAEGIERRIVSVLFADLVGFTTLSEELDPEDVAAVQDAYFATVRETIGRYGGVLEKFIGDAAMAVFGIPRSRDDDAERAVRAALAVVNAVEQLDARLPLAGGSLQVRVGVNTGEVVHSEPVAGEWRVTGDTVNTAARLQTAAPPGGVLLGEATTVAVAGAIELEPAVAIELKGKAEPVRASVALGARASPSREFAMGRLRAPIIGRDAELDRLDRALEEAVAGDPARLVIAAPPGVGKTRLVEEFVRRSVDSRGDVVAWRARLRPDAVGPYQPVAQVVLSALAGAGMDVRAGLPGRAADIARDALVARATAAGRARVVADHLVEVLSPPDASEPTRPVDRVTLFEAWLEGLDALAGPATQVWLIEDVHWAGGDVLAFLELAGSAPSPGGRLVLATARPALLERDGGWSAATAMIDLPPLTSPDASRLVRALVGEAIPDDLAGRVVERSDGNPLFIEELLRTWASVGVLIEESDGTWRLVSPSADIPLPATVQSIYAAQIDDLPPGARRVARRASVAGRRFPERALDPLEAPGTDGALARLVRRAFVAEVPPDPLLGPAYAYRHALLRDAGYASLARAERARLHARLARWLDVTAGSRSAEVAELIAVHYASALESTPRLTSAVDETLSREEARRLAVTWFERAGDAALAVAAHESARALFRRALDLLLEDEVIDGARLLLRVGDATALAADMDEGAAAYERSVELFRTALAGTRAGVAREGYARAASALGDVWNQQIRFAEAEGLADRALAEIGERDDAATARLLRLKAWALINRTDAYEEGLPIAERALDIARGTGDRDLELETLDTLVVIQTNAELVGAPAWTELARMAEERRDWRLAALGHRTRAGLLEDDRPDEAQLALIDARRVAREHGLTEPLAWADYEDAELGLRCGGWDAAFEAGRRAIDIGVRNAYHRVVIRTWFTVTPIADARRDTDLLAEASRWLETQTALPRDPPAPWARMMLGALRIRFARAGVEAMPTVRANAVREAFQTGSASAYAAMRTLVERWIEAGDLEDATTALEAAEASRAGTATTALFRAVVASLRARVDAAASDAGPHAAEEARAAAARFRETGAPWWEAFALRTLERAGDAKPEEIERAAEVERALGARG